MESVSTSESKNWRTTMLQSFAAKRGAQAEFARRVDCSESHLSLVLKGKRGLSYALAERIHAQAGIPINELMSPPLAPTGAGE